MSAAADTSRAGEPSLRRQALRETAAWAGLCMAALLTIVLLIAVCGYNPVRALAALARGSILSMDGWAATAVCAIPLAFTGLAVAVAFRGGALNIGAEGQYLAGALAAIIVGTQIAGIPAWLMIPAVMFAAALAGAGVGAVAGAMRVWRGIPEVLSTILLNFVMIAAVSYAVQGPLMEAGAGLPQSPRLPDSAQFDAFSPRYDLHSGVWVAIAAFVIVAFVINRTTVWFRLRAVGANPDAARWCGMPVGRTIFETMALSGALAGIAGMVEMAGITHRLYENYASNYGYTGIAVAMLGGLRPSGVLIAALFFGALQAGSDVMQREADIPSVMVHAAQGVVILFSVARGRGRP